MDLATLQSYSTSIGDGQHQIHVHRMLTMLDPSGRNNEQYPIELWALQDGCVFISLLGIEDATAYDVESFDEDINVWVQI